MRNKGLIFGLAFFVFGVIVSFLLYKRRKEIVKKLEHLTGLVGENVKAQFKELKNGIIDLLNRSKDLPAEKEEEILNLVEEKIKKLEEIIKL